ncbi:hypothetical protein DL765_008950 [Monosporascus sp. GIB2]|nr:hypothetical protein DL765_008950 [Monosporascus sp. GIB2]
MADAPKDSGVSLSTFFDRYDLPSGVKDECDEFVKSRFPEECRPCPFQGYCSYTVCVGTGAIVQFRPFVHKLDLGVMRTACEVFGTLAPETDYHGELGRTGLHIYSMRRLPGVSLLDLRADNARSALRARLENVVRDFAQLQAISWRHAKVNKDVTEKRTVGSSLKWRLELMAAGLPHRFRSIVASVLADLPDIERLPWAFSHGDLIPANIMVCPESGKILGLLDWAEAEYLPFGVGMYGLQELLGEDKDGRFVFYPEAKYLRELFWGELIAAIPELSRDTRRVGTIQKAQVLGILLWHGIAFDNGKLDRVVEEGKDDAEIERLDAFLLSPQGSGSRILRKNRMILGSPFATIRKKWVGNSRRF